MLNSFPHIDPHACYRDDILNMILPKKPQLDPECIFYQDPLMAVLDINTIHEQHFDRLSNKRTQYLKAHMDSFSEEDRNKLTEINNKMNETVRKFKTSAYLNDHEFKKLRKNKDHLIRSYVP